MRLTPEVLPFLQLRNCQLTLLTSLAFAAVRRSQLYEPKERLASDRLESLDAARHWAKTMAHDRYAGHSLAPTPP
jgi:hypothetical protein